MKIENECIVFGEEHYNPLGVIRSLGEAGIKPIAVVLRNSGTPCTSKSKYIKKLYKVKTKEEGLNLIIEKFGNFKQKSFIFTCDDKITAMLDEKYDLLKDRFYFFNAGSAGRITQFIDKPNIYKLAEKHGLDVLKSIILKKGDIPSEIEYPVITKPVNSNMGAWKHDMFICNNDDELKSAYKKIQSQELILQKYIVKKNEYCLDGFSINKGNDVFISIASTYKYFLPLSYSSYMDIFNFDKFDLKEELDCIFKEIGFEGIFSIEFLIDQNDELHFLEINFRNSTWSYASTCVGMNLPKLWLECTLNGKIEADSIYKKIPQNYTAMVELNDYYARVVSKKIKLGDWIKECKKTDCLFMKGKNDIKPFLSIIYIYILSLFKAVFKKIWKFFEEKGK